MPKLCCKATWTRIPDDEPVFILRGKDKLAATTVEKWLDLARTHNVNTDKILRAEEHLNDMQRFQVDHPERCKLPD